MKSIVCMLAFVFLSIPAAAQDATTYTSLQEIWRALARQNLSLARLDAALEQTELETRVREASRLPALIAGGGYNFISETARLTLPFTLPGMPVQEIEAGVNHQYDLNLRVQQPLFTGFRLKNEIALSRTQREKVSLQKAIARNRLFLLAGQIYYRHQLNRMQQAMLQKGLARLDLQLQKVRSFFRSEQATSFDTLEVFNRRLELANRLQQLRRYERIILTQLQHVLNDSVTVRIAETPPHSRPPIRLLPLPSYFQQALQSRPELQQLSLREKAQSHKIRIAKSALWPQIFASASFHYARPGVNFFEDEWMTYYTVGIQMQWRLWTWRQDGYRIQQAQIEQERLRLQKRALIQDIRQQVQEAYLNLQSALEQIRLQERLVDQERERYRRVSEQYDQGQAALLDLRNAEIRLTEAELQLQSNYIEAYQAHLQLQFAIGQFEPVQP